MVKSVNIDPALIESKAFLSLTGFAPQLLFFFLKRRRMKKVGRKGKEKWIIENNGEIVLTYATAEKRYGLTKPRFQKALKKLIEAGFIDVAHHGGGLLGDCSKYAISERWRKFGKEGFVEETLPKGTRGHGFTPENWEQRTGKKRRPSKPSNENVPFTSNENITALPVLTKGSGNENVTRQKSLNSLT